MASLKDLEQLSDTNLRYNLLQYGINCGPVTGTTRSLYIEKLRKAMGNKSSFANPEVEENLAHLNLTSTRERSSRKIKKHHKSMGNEASVLGEARIELVRPDRKAMLKGVNEKLGNAILDQILDKTGVNLKDIYGCEAAKQALEEAVVYPALNPSLFSGLRQPVKGILLFGPPGNGKTLLAKAVATESKQTFFNISAASLTSKWVGEGEKTVKALFQIARNAQPAIIFIDEIDSILMNRSDQEGEASRQMKTEFLIQFDGASSSDNDRILVIGATNRPYELDEAVLRRFPKRIMLDLPDENTRYSIICNTLKKHNHDKGVRDHDLRYIASKTKGYSNSDLVNLCKEAVMVPVRLLSEEKLRTIKKDEVRAIRASDFDEALRVIKPSGSIDGRHLQKMHAFARNSAY